MPAHSSREQRLWMYLTALPAHSGDIAMLRGLHLHTPELSLASVNAGLDSHVPCALHLLHPPGPHRVGRPG